MRGSKQIKKIIFFSLFVLGLFIFTSCKSKEVRFTFAYLADIHVQPELHAEEGFMQAVNAVNELKPDFVLTGGDLIMDAMAQPYERACMLYDMYKSVSENFEMPVYNTIGNHEHFGVSKGSGVDPSHPEFGKKMYQKRIGECYYSFDHKGWHFMVLDSIGLPPDSSYVGLIGKDQREWISQDLESVTHETPIIISTHIPLVTAYPLFSGNPVGDEINSLVVNDAHEILELFKDHNLRLVLQGHLHVLEDVTIGGIRFITAGAVSANWWEGPLDGMEEGFVLVQIKGETIDWEYVDFGWDPTQFEKEED